MSNLSPNSAVRKIGFALPRNQHIAQTALREGHASRRARRCRVPVHFYTICRSMRARFGLIARTGLSAYAHAARKFQRAPAEVFGFGVITATPGLTRSSQSLMPFGLPLRTSSTIVECVRRRIARQALLPVGRQQIAVVVQRVDIRGDAERGDVGVEAIDDFARLRGRPAMRLLDRDRLAGFCPPVGGEFLVELSVQLTRRIIGNIEQLGRRGMRGECAQGGQCQQHALDHSQPNLTVDEQGKRTPSHRNTCAGICLSPVRLCPPRCCNVVKSGGWRRGRRLQAE